MNRAALIILLALPLGACRLGGSRSVEAENDRLRRETAEQRARLAALEGEVRELRARLASSPATAGATAPTLPVATSVEVGRFSGFLPTSGDPAAPRRFRVEFMPLDGRGRFMQVAASAEIEVLQGAESPARSPTAPAASSRAALARVSLSPEEVREAYRSTFVGTFYEHVLDLPAPTPAGPLTIRVTLHDGLTGQTLVGEQIVKPRD